jgi:CPA2 family monovalent cation:H+ antiporter-2
MLLVAHVPSIISDISIILGLAIFVLLVCNYFKIHTVLGFLITGVLAGPGLLNLVHHDSDISVFAEIGIIFLLFSIGIEFSLKDMIRIRKQVFIGGSIQLFFTTAVIALIAFFIDIPAKEAVFLGLLFSLSSTAIVLKVLQETGRLQSPQGRSTMAILIFQDIAVVPLMLLTPYLSSKTGGLDFGFLVTILKGVVTVMAVVFVARTLMPRLLFAVAKSRSGELFLLTVLVVCLSVAWLTAQVGLSLSLGAFLAGLVISESEYSHEAFGTILPFREVFTSFFFISIGLLVDPNYLISHIPLILGVTALILFLKTVLSGGAIFITGNNLRVALLAGLFISQVGEFSFILAGSGRELGIITKSNYQLFLAVSLITMAFTPFIIQRSDSVSRKLNDWFMSDAMKERFPRLIRSSISQPMHDLKLKDHIVLIGFGDAGKNIAKVIRMAQIPFVAIDSDPEIILASKSRKHTTAIFGNATNASVLKHASVDHARVIVITVGNPEEIRNIVLAVRKYAPAAFIITTTKKQGEFVRLFDAGANDVISEEFETSVELITRVLTKYLVQRNDIEAFIVKLRGINYAMQRSIRYEQQGLQDYRLEMSDTEILTIKVHPQSPLKDKSLRDLELRIHYGVSVLAIKRDKDIIANPEGELQLLENDILVIFGSHDAVDKLARL